MNTSNWKKTLLQAALSLVALALVPTQALAWDQTGIVTGRIYDELKTNSAPLAELHAMQVGWIRIEFEEFAGLPAGTTLSDSRVLANRDKFRAVITNARAKNLKVLGVISANAMEYRTDFPTSDLSIDTYVKAVKWHLDNYVVDAVELWNEPGSTPPFDTSQNLNRYAKLLIETYKLKPSYPNVFFVGPATVNAERGTWLGYHGTNGTDYRPEDSIFNCTAMINYRNANGYRLPLDVISWHPYGSGNYANPDSGFYYGRTFATYYQEILNYTDRQGRNVINGANIWFTEYGWDSTFVGEENQRIYTERMMTLIFARPQVKVPFLYDFRDDENVAGTENKKFGIRKNSAAGFAKKRVYYPFISKNSLAGLFTQDGTSEWTIDQIADKYVTAGGVDVIGRAYRHPSAPWYGDKAHYWGPNNNGIIQQFNSGTLGECGILLKGTATAAWLLKGSFYTFYMANNGPYNASFGWPTSDEYISGSYYYQNLEFGRLRRPTAGGSVDRVPL